MDRRYLACALSGVVAAGPVAQPPCKEMEAAASNASPSPQARRPIFPASQ